MSNQTEKSSSVAGQCIYIVMCYQSIVGVYANFEDAMQIAKTFIDKGRVCDVSSQFIK